MTDKEKLKEITKLADAMYYAAFNLTTDASRLKKAMNEYRQFIINEYGMEESASEDLEEATNNYGLNVRKGYPRVKDETDIFICNAFKAGANWQKQNLWKPANGDDLPILDREVIALLDNGKVVFAHRLPEYWDGKNITTDKVTRYYPKTYDKGGWNIPNVKYWLDCYLPKEIEL